MPHADSLDSPEVVAEPPAELSDAVETGVAVPADVLPDVPPEPAPRALVVDDPGRRPAALVTGARRGIGRAIAIALAEAGFDVAITDVRASDELEQVAAHLSMLGARAVSVIGDVAELASHEIVLDTAEAAFGPLDCLVNNAAISRPPIDLLEVTPEAYDGCQAVNARGTFFLTQAFARRLLKRPPRGHHRSIVTVTGTNAMVVATERGDYCASKAAEAMVSRLFAARLADAGVGVYEVAPGWIEEASEPGTGTAQDDANFAIERLIGQKGATPQAVGAAVATLARGALPCSSGQRIEVGGQAFTEGA